MTGHRLNVFSFDLTDIFYFTVSPLELMLRGTLMYWFLFIIFRFILRCDVGSLGISDFLFVVILGDAAQNSMIGNATLATDGTVLIGTLVFWSCLRDFMSAPRPAEAGRPPRGSRKVAKPHFLESYQFPALRRFISAPRLCLVRDGKLLRKNMRREFITDGDLAAKVRQEGIEDIGTVKLMYLEADGEMSVIRRDAPGAGA